MSVTPARSLLHSYETTIIPKSGELPAKIIQLATVLKQMFPHEGPPLSDRSVSVRGFINYLKRQYPTEEKILEHYLTLDNFPKPATSRLIKYFKRDDPLQDLGESQISAWEEKFDASAIRDFEKSFFSRISELNCALEEAKKVLAKIPDDNPAKNDLQNWIDETTKRKDALGARYNALLEKTDTPENIEESCLRPITMSLPKDPVYCLTTDGITPSAYEQTALTQHMAHNLDNPLDPESRISLVVGGYVTPDPSYQTRLESLKKKAPLETIIIRETKVTIPRDLKFSTKIPGKATASTADLEDMDEEDEEAIFELTKLIKEKLPQGQKLINAAAYAKIAVALRSGKELTSEQKALYQYGQDVFQAYGILDDIKLSPKVEVAKPENLTISRRLNQATANMKGLGKFNETQDTAIASLANQIRPKAQKYIDAEAFARVAIARQRLGRALTPEQEALYQYGKDVFQALGILDEVNSHPFLNGGL